MLVADKGTKGTSNMLNFNVCCAWACRRCGACPSSPLPHTTQVAEGAKLQLPNTFWTRLQSTFGNTFFVKENGEDVAIRRAVDAPRPLCP